jgi:arabinofuranosyltransferase
MPRVQGPVGPVGPARPLARRLLQWALLGLPVVILLVQGLRYRCVVDDGFIYLRIVRNVVEGHGPVFNVGQRVEAYTGPLWVGVLAAADVASPFRLEWIAVVAGIACTIGGVVLAMLGAARLTRDSDTDALLAPAGMLVFAVLPATW